MYWLHTNQLGEEERWWKYYAINNENKKTRRIRSRNHCHHHDSGAGIRIGSHPQIQLQLFERRKTIIPDSELTYIHILESVFFQPSAAPAAPAPIPPSAQHQHHNFKRWCKTRIFIFLSGFSSSNISSFCLIVIIYLSSHIFFHFDHLLYTQRTEPNTKNGLTFIQHPPALIMPSLYLF